MPSPRFIKSHLPLQLLPTQLTTLKPKVCMHFFELELHSWLNTFYFRAHSLSLSPFAPQPLRINELQIIYVARNPKDLCVSYYHYCLLVHGLVGTFEEFCEMFLNDNAPIGPVWPHMLDFWNMRHEPNVLFLKYEDMKKDLASTIYMCAKFLGVENSISDKDVAQMCDHLKFDRMQKNPAVNIKSYLPMNGDSDQSVQFIRKGQIGDWKNYMSSELSARFDEWTRKHTEGTELEFEYE